MKKLFALLLALCLMCGAVSAGAEDDWEFFIEDPSDEATSRSYATPFISFEVPVEWEEMNVVASEANEVSFETVYTTVYKDNPVSLIVRIGASKNGATRTYEELKERVHAQYKEIETEEGIRILLVQSTNNYVVYNTFLDDVRLTIAATTGTSQQLGINMAFMDTFFNEVVYPVILSAELPDGTTVASAVATEAADADADAEAARIAAEQAAAQKYVVITNSSANIRSGPDGSAAKIITARQGDTFPLIREEGNWYVIDVNGQTGYVTKSLSAIQ